MDAMKTNAFSFLFIAIFLSGCASSSPYAHYKKNRGGFVESRIGQDAFSLSYAGNGVTPAQQAKDFLLLRCGELTKMAGCSFFVITRVQDRSENATAFISSPGYANGYATNMGGFTAVNMSYTPGMIAAVPFFYPYYNYHVQCFVRQPKESASEVYDAEYVISVLRARYKLHKPMEPLFECEADKPLWCRNGTQYLKSQP